MTYQPQFKRLDPKLVVEVRTHLDAGKSHREVCEAMGRRVSMATVSRVRNNVLPGAPVTPPRFELVTEFWPDCQHERTPENTTTVGSKMRLSCKTCVRARARDHYAARTKRTEVRKTTHDSSTAVATYRMEKALAESRRLAVLEDAKASYAQMLERERERQKGGRPKSSGKGGQQSITILPSSWSKARRSDFTKGDPADALITALGHYGPNV